MKSCKEFEAIKRRQRIRSAVCEGNSDIVPKYKSNRNHLHLIYISFTSRVKLVVGSTCETLVVRPIRAKLVKLSRRIEKTKRTGERLAYQKSASFVSGWSCSGDQTKE